VSALAGEDLAALPYGERLPRLLAHGFGVWDVLGACERQGSLDANIRKPAANDFARLRALCSRLETAGFNGQTSGKFAPQRPGSTRLSCRRRRPPMRRCHSIKH
jgi:hypoxanthine-DNA glycosylase